MVSSPTTSPDPPAAATALDSKLEIGGVKSMSEEEGDEFGTEEERQKRIEKLAQQIMDEKMKLEKLEEIEAKQKTEQIRMGADDGEINRLHIVLLDGDFTDYIP